MTIDEAIEKELEDLNILNDKYGCVLNLENWPTWLPESRKNRSGDMRGPILKEYPEHHTDIRFVFDGGKWVKWIDTEPTVWEIYDKIKNVKEFIVWCNREHYPNDPIGKLKFKRYNPHWKPRRNPL